MILLLDANAFNAKKLGQMLRSGLASGGAKWKDKWSPLMGRSAPGASRELGF